MENSTFSMIARAEYVEFEQRISEIMDWCVLRARDYDPRASLRMPALHPSSEISTYRYGLVEDGVNVVSRLAEARRHLLAYIGTERKPAPIAWTRGRLLLYQPDASFKDSLTQGATNGFFDELDAPPWDTWVWYEEKGSVSYLADHFCEGYLVSWIPEMFVDLAEEGIRVQPYGALAWADQRIHPSQIALTQSVQEKPGE